MGKVRTALTLAGMAPGCRLVDGWLASGSGYRGSPRLPLSCRKPSRRNSATSVLRKGATGCFNQETQLATFFKFLPWGGGINAGRTYQHAKDPLIPRKKGYTSNRAEPDTANGSTVKESRKKNISSPPPQETGHFPAKGLQT